MPNDHYVTSMSRGPHRRDTLVQDDRWTLGGPAYGVVVEEEVVGSWKGLEGVLIDSEGEPPSEVDILQKSRYVLFEIIMFPHRKADHAGPSPVRWIDESLNGSFAAVVL